MIRHQRMHPMLEYQMFKNENHVLVEVVEATAMMHHTQLALQDVYNHHCRYVEMASHLHITVH